MNAELKALMAGMEDVLRQAAECDGFKTPERIRWEFNQTGANNEFRVAPRSLTGRLFELSVYRQNLYEYRRVLMSDSLLGSVQVDADDLLAVYRLKDSHNGMPIVAEMRFYLQHPPEYREALEAAGSIRSHHSAYVSCSA